MLVRIRALLVGLVVAAAVVACGGGDDANNPATRPLESTTPQRSPNPSFDSGPQPPVESGQTR